MGVSYLDEISLLNNSILISHERNNFQSSRQLLLIIFEIVRILSSICIVLGILGNFALIYIICKTSFRHVSYGLLIAIIALFDTLRLCSSIYYYFLFANLISMNSFHQMIYTFIDRYPIFVVNWCKVLMSIERFLTVRYWEHHTHLDWRSKHKRKQYRQFSYLIIFIFICGLISQYQNYKSQSNYLIQINYQRLMFINQKNSLLNHHKYLSILSYLIFDTTMPVFIVLILNLFLYKEIRRLPLPLQVKVKESIGILFFLTGLSIAILPRAFLAFYLTYSTNQNEFILHKFISMFYICLGFEYFNHAITGYACFLQSALLRSELKNMIWTRYIAPHLH